MIQFIAPFFLHERSGRCVTTSDWHGLVGAALAANAYGASHSRLKPLPQQAVEIDGAMIQFIAPFFLHERSGRCVTTSDWHGLVGAALAANAYGASHSRLKPLPQQAVEIDGAMIQFIAPFFLHERSGRCVTTSDWHGLVGAALAANAYGGQLFAAKAAPTASS